MNDGKQQTPSLTRRLFIQGGNLPTITKSHLAKMLAEEKNLNGTQAKDLVDAFFQALTESIIQGDRIEARGFGVFVVKETNARPNARNPRSGQEVFVPARRKVMFKPGKVLKGELGRPREGGEETTETIHPC